MRVPAYISNIDEWKQSFQFSVSVNVRFSETDAFGHLNNTNAFVYFEKARLDYLTTLGLMQKWLDKESTTIIVVADLQCDFLQQIKFDEKLSIAVKVHKFGRTSMDIHYLVLNANGDMCLTGRGTVVQIVKQTGRSVAWSEEEKRTFHKLQ